MAREHPDRDYRAREAALLAKRKKRSRPHDCWDHIEYVETDGTLGQAYYCAVCGALLQVG